MTMGAGKYDDVCTEARTKAKAIGCILIVLDGEHGSGFSCQASFADTLRLPDILEDVAKNIRSQFKEGKL